MAESADLPWTNQLELSPADPEHLPMHPTPRGRCRSLVPLTLAAAVALAWPSESRAICGLDEAVIDQIRKVSEPDTARAFSLKLIQSRGAASLSGQCSICHISGTGGPRNAYGAVVNVLLSIADREVPVRQREVGERVRHIPADPTRLNSPTFGELIRQGRFPGSVLVPGDPPQNKRPAIEPLTVARAREAVTAVEAESRWGIVQFSNTPLISPAVADALATFRGEMLILGVTSLSPDVATALARSRAATVWLHSVTADSPKAADALARFPGDLVLTGLAELDSVPLAEKLAKRQAALNLPYLRRITSEVAAALAKTPKSLTLAGLTTVPQAVQDRLAETAGVLYLPNISSLNSAALTKKLAIGQLVLPNLQRLTDEQATTFAAVKAVSFFSGIVLPLRVMTPTVATAFADARQANNLTLVGGGPIADDVFETLLNSRVNLSLPGIEALTPKQVDTLAKLADRRKRPAPGVLAVAAVNLPGLKKLDSAELALALLAFNGGNFPGVTEISREAADALGRLPDNVTRLSGGQDRVLPSYNLNFPSLTELSPEVARLLLKKRWLSIALPAVEDYSLATLRGLAKQSSQLTLGMTSLPAELAPAFGEIATDTGGGTISLPFLRELSPEAARVLVKTLNRGVEDRGYIRLSKSPNLYLGGDLGTLVGGLEKLPAAVAVELAKYEGTLGLFGLRELPDASAAALETFPGPYLRLSGRAADKLSPAAAASLAKVPGNLLIPLRTLDSVPLAARFARQINWTLYNLETVADKSVPGLVQYKQFFRVRQLTTLADPALAKRIASGPGSGGVTLPALTTLSGDAAKVLVTNSKSLYLGLAVLDSPAVARAFATAAGGVKLPRLRAATPEVLAILKANKTIETPALETIYPLTGGQK